jgi:hypothetical protein
MQISWTSYHLKVTYLIYIKEKRYPRLNSTSQQLSLKNFTFST